MLPIPRSISCTLKCVGSHHNHIFQSSPLPQSGPDPDYTTLQVGIRDDTAITNNYVVYGTAIDFAGRKITGSRINWIALGEEVELWNRIRQLQVGLEKCFHRTDVFPIAFKNISPQFSTTQEAWNYFLTEIRGTAVQRFDHGFPIEDVDTHRG